MTKYVTGFAFSDDQSKVVLIKKTKPEWQAGRFNGVGGKIEEGETPVQAMVREFKEETGLETTLESWNVVCVFEGKDFVVNFFSRFGDDIHDVKTTTEETVLITDTAFAHDVPELYISNLLWLIPMALNHRGGEVSAVVKY